MPARSIWMTRASTCRPSWTCGPTRPGAVGGAANGAFGLRDCIREGLAAGAAAASAVGFGDGHPAGAPQVETVAEHPIVPFWLVPDESGATQFVDLERDVTVADIRRA